MDHDQASSCDSLLKALMSWCDVDETIKPVVSFERQAKIAGFSQLYAYGLWLNGGHKRPLSGCLPLSENNITCDEGFKLLVLCLKIASANAKAMHGLEELIHVRLC